MPVKQRLLPRSAAFCTSARLRFERKAYRHVRYKQQDTSFESIIPDVIEEMASDPEYQALLRKTSAKSQAVLTHEETDRRQAVLEELDIAPWMSKMKVLITSLSAS
jgi:hypothetical protein